METNEIIEQITLVKITDCPADPAAIGETYVEVVSYGRTGDPCTCALATDARASARGDLHSAGCDAVEVTSVKISDLDGEIVDLGFCEWEITRGTAAERAALADWS